MIFKKNILVPVILGLIFIISCIPRLPLFDSNLEGYDAYTLYKLSNEINSKGFVSWSENIFSLIGIYPLSYQSGGLVFLSVLSNITGLNLSITVIFWNIFLTFIVGLLSFLISKQFFKNELISLLYVFIMINTPQFYHFSNRTISMRSIFLIFFMTFIWVNFFKKKNYKFILFSIFFLIAIFIHKLFLIIPVLFLVFYFQNIFQKNKIKHFNLLIFILTCILVVVSYFLFINLVQTRFISRFPISFGLYHIDRIFDIIYRFVMQYGLIILLFPISYLFLIFEVKSNDKRLLLLLFILCFSLFITEQTYFSFIIFPVIILISTMAIEKLFNFKNWIRVVSLIFVIVLVILPYLITINSNDGYSEVYELDHVRLQTTYLRDYLISRIDSKKIICNYVNSYCNQITALSDNKINSLSTLSLLLDTSKFNFEDVDFIFELPRRFFEFEENIVNIPLYPSIYEFYLIRYHYYNEEILYQMLDFTDVKFILNSEIRESLNNMDNLRQKYGETNQIYNNGLQQISPVNYNDD